MDFFKFIKSAATSTSAFRAEFEIAWSATSVTPVHLYEVEHGRVR
jgi:hypothetical protein